MENQLNEKQNNLSKPDTKTKKAKKVEIPHHFLLSKKYITPVGNKMQPVYELEYDPKIRKDLVKKVGEEDIDDFIQKCATQTDFAYLQREAIRTGQYPFDPDAQYGVDMTLMPTNIHELHKFSQDYNNAFDRLGEHGKSCFGSADAYKAAIMDGSAELKLSNYFSQLEKKELEKLKKGDDDDKK